MKKISWILISGIMACLLIGVGIFVFSSKGSFRRPKEVRIARQRESDNIAYIREVAERMMSSFGPAEAFASEDDPAQEVYEEAQQYFNKLKYDQAIEKLEYLLNNYPESPLAYPSRFVLGYCYLMIKEFSKSIETFKEFVAKHPKAKEVPTALFSIGGCYQELDEYQKAIDYYQQAIPNYSDKGLLYYRIGLNYMLLKNYPKAIINLQKVIANYPDSMAFIDAYYLLGNAYRLNEEYDRALEIHKKILGKSGTEFESEDVVCQIGKTYFSKEDYSKAIEWFQKVISEYPATMKLKADAQFMIGLSYYEWKKFDEAEDAYIKVIKNIDPKHAFSYSLLALLYAEREIKLDKALEYAKKAIEFGGENTIFYRSLGWVKYKRGIIDGAIKDLHKALNLVPPDEEDKTFLATLHYYLGMAYLAKGWKEQAIDEFRKAIEFAPESVSGKNAKEELEKLGIE